MRWLPIRRQQLPRQRLAARTSAYVYGNIMALSALTGTAHPGEIISGHALIVLISTGIFTLFAHGLAHRVAYSVEYPGAPPAREHFRSTARDSLPIASSTALPALFLLSGTLGWLSELVAMQLAIGTVVFRFLLLGIVVSRESGSSRIPLSALLTGIGLAIAGIAIAIGKTLLTH